MASRIDPAHWRTRRALAPGRYYVPISTVDLAGVTGCSPRLPARCQEAWSNVQPIVASRSPA